LFLQTKVVNLPWKKFYRFFLTGNLGEYRIANNTMKQLLEEKKMAIHVDKTEHDQ